MPDLKPVDAPASSAKKKILLGVLAFIVLAFVFAYLINI
jgi:hypothetical protein